jgi:hypothetical protein
MSVTIFRKSLFKIVKRLFSFVQKTVSEMDINSTVIYNNLEVGRDNCYAIVLFHLILSLINEKQKLFFMSGAL